jgi:hypothetical protein
MLGVSGLLSAVEKPMSLGRFQFPFLASAVCALVVSSVPAQADHNSDQSQPQSGAPAQKIWQAEMPDQPPQVEKHPTRHKLMAVAKGLKQELATSLVDTAKDAAFVFSVQDIDPYDETKVPKNKPYRMLDMQLVDGTIASLIKYPDGSGRINGGFADGTVFIPDGNHQYLVKYPNGARGRMEKVGNAYKIYRPDNSITTISRDGNGKYEMTNDKIGYMGEAVPDETGLTYELK